MEFCTPSWLLKLFTPEWLTALGTVGTVVLALALALWGEEISRLFVRPKLSLKARVRRPDSEKTKWQTAAGASLGTVYFFRLAVRNRGNTAAHDVQLFLAGVERVSGGGVEEVTAFTPMNLKWAYRGSATLPSLLQDMPPTHCDLAHVNEPMVGWISEQQRDAPLVLDVEFSPNTQGHVLGAGTYYLRLILAAANCRPRNYKLEVIFSGSWFADEQTMFDAGFKMRCV